MCNEETLRAEAQARRVQGVSRRDFNILALSAAAVALLPGAAQSASVSESMVKVPTPDGSADCYFVHPTSGKHPAILLWPDFMSLRPAYQQMAKRLAESGYSVLVINQYYRWARSPIMEKANFDDDVAMKKIFGWAKLLTNAHIDADAKASIEFLDRQPSVDIQRKVGTVGYCMAGRFAFRTAAIGANRVGAVASFHASGLATKSPDSPHLLIPKFRAHALVGIAAGDVEKEPETKQVLQDAFAAARLPAEVEVYEGTVHGWCTPDMSAYYHEQQAARAWGRLLNLFGTALA